MTEQQQPLTDAHPNVPRTALRAEQARLLYAGIPVSLAVNVLIAMILVATQHGMLNTVPIIVWCALLGATLVLRTVFAVTYSKAQTDELASENWLTRFRIGTAATGIAWGLASFLLFPADDIPHQSFLIFAIAGMTAGAVTSLSIDLVSSLAFIIPALVPLIARLFAEGGEIPDAMGAMGTLYLVALVLNTRRTYISTYENIGLRLEAVTRENALRESESQLLKAQEVAQMGSWNLDITHNKLFWSPQIYRIFGISPGTPLTYGVFIGCVHPDDREKVDTAWNAALRGAPYNIEHRIVLGGKTHWVREIAEVQLDSEGLPLTGIGTVQDITEHKRMEQEIRRINAGLEDRVRERTKELEQAQVETSALLRRYKTLMMTSMDGIHIMDVQGHIVEANDAFCNMLGYAREEVAGLNVVDLEAQYSAEDLRERFKTLIGKSDLFETLYRHKNGTLINVEISVNGVEMEGLGLLFASSRDITARKQAQEEIHNLAFYDALTKLPNRRLLLDRFRLALSMSARSNHYGAVLFLDMDKFKTLNDTLGHDYGDLMLIEVARRIQVCVREMETVARLGGDEFVVLIEEISDSTEDASQKVALIAEKIRASLARPYQLNGHTHHSSPSIGVCLYRGDEESVDTLLKHADMAMYQAKDSGRNTVQFFDPAMQQAVEIHTELEADLRYAVTDKQLHLYYQIQLDNDHRPLGAEALVRWIHPKRGMIPPAQFIPIAEKSSLILDIGHWVLETICRQLKEWSRHEQTRHLELAVNISVQQFRLQSFVDTVAAMVRIHEVNPARLKLEMTENAILTDIANVVAKMHALKAIGVKLSMDDFGTGYASLSCLKQLPLDQIKIDQSFKHVIATDPNDTVMVQTIINLAQNFSLNVIAEGVETEAQLNFLKLNGCMAYQGYLFSKPVPIEEFEGLLRQGSY